MIIICFKVYLSHIRYVSHKKIVQHTKIKIKYCKGAIKIIILIIVNKSACQEISNQIIPIFNHIHQKIQKYIILVKVLLPKKIKMKNILVKVVLILLDTLILNMVQLCLWTIILLIAFMQCIFNSRLLTPFTIKFLYLMLKFKIFIKIIMKSHHHKIGKYQHVRH